MKKFVFAQFMVTGIIIALVCSPVSAFEQIPKESGFDGFVRLGGGYSWVKSNMVSGPAFNRLPEKFCWYCEGCQLPEGL